MKKFLKDYFSFSKKERVAVFVLIVVIAIFLALPYFVTVKKQPIAINNKLAEQINEAKQQKSHQKYSDNNSTENENWGSHNSSSNNNNTKFELFEFDPNTLDAKGWKKLGIRDKTVQTIFNYLSKGGKFKTPEDIRKIWGLKKEEADRIIPYAKIATTNYGNGNLNGKSKIAPSNILLDANKATVEELKTIPNIGNSLPYRIVNYREKLGGFLNMLQVKETYGITDSIFKAIQMHLHVLPTQIKKVNINTATDFELNQHPYIDKNLAKAIVIRRMQHGAYATVQDVQKIAFVTNDVFKKIEPYLTVQ